MNQNFCVNHSNQVMEFICTNYLCSKQLIFCKLCIELYHSNHQNECSELINYFDEIEQKLSKEKEKLFNTISSVSNLFEENINVFTTQIQNISKLIQDNNPQNEEYIQQRKFQIVHLIEAIQQVSNMTEQINQLGSQIERKNNSIAQDIGLCEIQIISSHKKQQYDLELQTNQVNPIKVEQQNLIEDQVDYVEQKKIIFFDDEQDSFEQDQQGEQQKNLDQVIIPEQVTQEQERKNKMKQIIFLDDEKDSSEQNSFEQDPQSEQLNHQNQVQDLISELVTVGQQIEQSIKINDNNNEIEQLTEHLDQEVQNRLEEQNFSHQRDSNQQENELTQKLEEQILKQDEQKEKLDIQELEQKQQQQYLKQLLEKGFGFQNVQIPQSITQLLIIPQNLLDKIQSQDYQFQFSNANSNRRLVSLHNQTLERIENIVKKPIQFFCNPEGNNVFASDGESVKIVDILPIENNKDYFPYLMFYVAKNCPKQLQNIFITQSISQNGQYEILKPKNGENKNQENFIVDDKFPISENANTLLSKNNSICFSILFKLILENKTLMIYYKNYSYVSLLEDMFDWEAVRIDCLDELLIENLEKEIQFKNFILFHMEISYGEFQIYQLLDVVRVKNLFDEEVILFKICSAYGRDCYQGEWGFNSPMWTDKMKEELQVSEDDDGIFYIDHFSVIKQVAYIYSMRVIENKLTKIEVILRKNQASYFQLDLETDDYLDIHVKQQNKNDRHSLLKTKILVSDIETNQLIYRKLTNSVELINLFLTKGSYYIYIKPLTQVSDFYEATIDVSGLSEIKINQIQKIENYKMRVFQNQIQQKGKIVLKQNVYEAKKLDLMNEGWCIYQFTNLSNDQKLQLQFQIEGPIKKVLCKPFTSNFLQEEISINDKILIIAKIFYREKNKIQIMLNNELIQI